MARHLHETQKTLLRLGAKVESSILQATRPDPRQAFSGLSPDERNHLREWRSAARVIDVDAVEDLASRPWPCLIAGTVIGIFRGGGDAASWLVIGHNGTWAVASCKEGTVSHSVHSLAEALAMIYPGPVGQGRRGHPPLAR